MSESPQAGRGIGRRLKALGLSPDRAQAASGVPWRGHRATVIAWSGDASTHAAPDLGTQLEDLLTAVWEAEADWRLCDRIDRGKPPPI